MSRIKIGTPDRSPKKTGPFGLLEKEYCRETGCAACVHFLQLYGKEYGVEIYRECDKGWCKQHAILTPPEKAACPYWRKPVTFTVEDREQLDALNLKLQTADRIEHIKREER